MKVVRISENDFMAQTKSFKSKLDSLRNSHAGELQKRLESLRTRVERGSYDKEDLSELSSILKTIRNDLIGNDVRMAEIVGIPGKTIASTYSGKSKPRYTNFMKMLHGALDICRAEIQLPGSQHVSSSTAGDMGFQDRWISEWVAIDRNETQRKIGTLVECLEHLVLLAKHSNSPAGPDSTFTEIESKQLVAVLETALAMLKSPMVEVGFLRRLAGWLRTVTMKSAERETESAIKWGYQEGI